MTIHGENVVAVISPQSRVKIVGEIADELKVHQITIYRLLKKDKIAAFKIRRV